MSGLCIHVSTLHPWLRQALNATQSQGAATCCLLCANPGLCNSYRRPDLWPPRAGVLDLPQRQILRTPTTTHKTHWHLHTFATGGLTYDRRALEDWIRRNGTDPATGHPLASGQLYSNLNLRDQVSTRLLLYSAAAHGCSCCFLAVCDLRVANLSLLDQVSMRLLLYSAAVHCCDGRLPAVCAFRPTQTPHNHATHATHRSAATSWFASTCRTPSPPARATGRARRAPPPTACAAPPAPHTELSMGGMQPAAVFAGSRRRPPAAGGGHMQPAAAAACFALSAACHWHLVH